MRPFHILFAFYLISLSMVPCGDTSAGHEESVATELAHSHSDSDHAEHADHCSPFCICSCCGISMAFLNFESFEITKVIVNDLTQPTCYNQRAASLFNHTIWQPPKI